MPKISVVMPVYNSEKYLREAIDSILNQTYGDFEFIIIDDGSTDSSPEIVRSYSDPRIRFYVNEHNMGVAATLNRGLDLATGEYIARMDSDDISLPQRFAKQVSYMSLHPQCAVCGTDMLLFGVQHGVFAHSNTPDTLKIDLIFASSLAHPTVMIRRSIIEENMFRYNTFYNEMEDYELWIRIADQYQLGNINEVLHKYRIHPNQITQHYSDEFKTKIHLLKKAQVEQLGIHTDSNQFEAYVDFCCGNRDFNEKYILNLFTFFDQIKIANKSQNIYHIYKLDKYLKKVKNNILNSTTNSIAIKVIKKRGEDPISYYLRRKAHSLYWIIRRWIKQKTKYIQLKNKKFTIISNNCWGGIISEKYGLRKNSPTVGLLILGNDYVKFCKNLKEYIAQKLVFIPMECAKYYEIYKDTPFPVARLGDIEIYFMHYKTAEIAAEKWYRRCKRINWNCIVYKISERETFTPQIMKEFASLSLDHKLIFATQKYTEDTVIIDGLNKLIGDETTLLSKYFDELAYFNSI